MQLLRIVALAAFLAAFSMAQDTAPYYPAGWVDLYKAPYSNLPTMIMSLACIQDTCLVPGMTNGVGIYIYTMDGSYNAPMNAMNMDGEIPVAIMGIAAGGSKANAHGVAGGPDILGGLKFLVNSTTWTAPLTIPFVALIGITADKQTGKRIAFPDLLIEGLWISYDGGFEFNMKNTSEVILPTSNCTYARYVANPSDNVIYITYGNFPNSSKHSSISEFLKKKSPTETYEYQYAMGRSIEFTGDGKHMKKHRVSRLRQIKEEDKLTGFSSSSSSSSSDNPDNHCPFSAAVVKSTDGGNTWTTVFQELGTFYPNEIDCASETHCAFVTDSEDGAGIYRTTNGVHFEKVFSISNNASAIFSLMTIAVSPVNSSLWFAAGNVELPETDKGFVARSEDGGATWVAETPLNFLAEIMKISFAGDGNAYAAAETLFQAATILRYTPSGPPATPAPAYTGSITQKVFATGDCSGAANVSSFAQNQCLQASGGGSMTMACDMTDGVIVQNMYILSDSCAGPFEQAAAGYGLCLQANGGGTVEFLCGSQSEAPLGTVGVSIKK